MGIRYFALSIDTEDCEHIKRGRCGECGELPTLRELDDDADDRESLDLDKGWRDFQGLFSNPIRPALALVRGDVTHTGYGWRSYRGLIGPSEAADVAADLATVHLEALMDESRTRTTRSRGLSEWESEYRYLSELLARAQKFTSPVAAEGRGICYWIG